MAHKPERLDKLLANLGYGSRKDVKAWIQEGWVLVNGMLPASAAEKVLAEDVRLMDEPLDHPYGLSIVYHKPLGSVCSRKEDGRLIYADFPERWLARKPVLSPVGRLDKNSSGLLIVTDNGLLNHQITSPKQHISKTYQVTLDRPLKHHAIQKFAQGIKLEDDDRPCLPAELTIHDELHAQVILHEGRYHQVRRMFAAIGNHVVALERSHLGRLALADSKLAAGQYLSLNNEDLMRWIHTGVFTQ